MSRVKFATKHEYEYLGNYKVLQTCFTRNKIDKVRAGTAGIESAVFVYRICLSLSWDSSWAVLILYYRASQPTAL